MLRHLSLIALACVLTVIGLAGGWFAARQNPESAATEEDTCTESEPGAEESKLGKRALANLGVTVGPAKRTTYVRYRAVQAIVEHPGGDEAARCVGDLFRR